MAQESDTPYLFVSYASRDRDRVLPVVDRLSHLGIRFWIDKNKIPGGADYTQEIPPAIRKSRGLVVFVSRHAFASDNVKKELGIAWERRKPLLPLLLEEVEIPEKFFYHLVDVQHIALFGEGEERWIESIQLALQAWKIDFDVGLGEGNGGTALVQAAKGRDVQMAASPLIPYLVDRLQPERELQASLDAHYQEHSRRPLVFLVYSRAEQAIYEYLDRLEKVSLPKELSRHNYADIVKWINLPWLRNTNYTNETEQTLRTLRRDVEVGLELKPGTWPNGLVQALADLRATLVFCYHLHWEDWGDAHLAMLRAWALDWSQLPNLPPGYPLISFFAVEYDSVKPSFFQRMLHKQVSEHPIREQLSRLLQVNGHGVTITLLSELGNVTKDDVEDWIRDVVKLPNKSRMIRLVSLEVPDLLAQSGVPMVRLAEHLARVIERAGREGK
jgi:hypothetical protein